MHPLISSGHPTLFAGMPAPLPIDVPQTVRLTDLTVARLQTISFFLVVLLAATAGLWLLWNYLRRDVPALPRLSFGRAMAAVFLWGTLAVVVLTMISGARELMTPGAWVRKGATYTLTDPPAPVDRTEKDQLQERKRKLKELGEALRKFARYHDGRFPTADEVGQIPAELWTTPTGGRYEYIPGSTLKDEWTTIAREPAPPDGGPIWVINERGFTFLQRSHWDQPKPEVAPPPREAKP